MTSVEQFRAVFDKAHVVCDNGVLMASYRKAWSAPEQAIEASGLACMVQLLRECDYVRVRLVDGVSVDISFGLNGIVSEHPMVFAPVSPDLTEEEVDARIEKRMRESPPDYSLFYKHFDGVDVSDKADVVNRMLDLVSERDQEQSGDGLNVTSLPSVVRWSTVLRRAKSFVKKHPAFALEVVGCGPEDEYYALDVYLSSKRQNAVCFNREQCQQIAAVFEQCDSINICGMPKDNESFLTVSLFVEKFTL